MSLVKYPVYSLLVCVVSSVSSLCMSLGAGLALPPAGPGAVAASYEAGTGSWSPADDILWPPKSQKNKQSNINKFKKLIMIGCPFLKKRNLTKCTQGCRELPTFFSVSGKLFHRLQTADMSTEVWRLCIFWLGFVCFPRVKILWSYLGC